MNVKALMLPGVALGLTAHIVMITPALLEATSLEAGWRIVRPVAWFLLALLVGFTYTSAPDPSSKPECEGGNIDASMSKGKVSATRCSSLRATRGVQPEAPVGLRHGVIAEVLLLSGTGTLIIV